MKPATRFAATALCLSLLLGLAPLTLADGTDLTTSASLSSPLCSVDYTSATVNISVLVTSTASAAPANVTVSKDGGATFTPVSTISVWSHSGSSKSATLAFSEVVPANTTTNLEICAAQPGSNGNPDKSSCANLSVDPACASYLPRTTLDYTAHGADFLLIGDWGNDADFGDMVNVAGQMNTTAAASNSNFVISLGNNFYQGGSYNYEGVESPTDDKFRALWKRVYAPTSPPLLPALSQLPWWLVLGNHDWYTAGDNPPTGTVPGSPIFEMEHQDPNWNLPDYFYVQRFALPNSKHATLIYVDTDLLFYGYAGKKDMKYNFMYAGWSTAEHTHLKQLAWMDKALETANQDDYVLVIAHHPTFTCGSDVAGSFDMGDKTAQVPQDPTDLGLLGLIRKWKPTAYINAHHNTLAYYFDGPTLQLQPGSGGNVDAACAPLYPTTGQELPNTYGFGHAQLTGPLFKITFVTETGSLPFVTQTAGPRTPVTGVTANTTYLPPNGDPSIHNVH